VIKLQEYKIDKNLDSNETYLNLKKFIDEYTNNSTNLNFIKKVSEKFNIPENIIKLKFKRLVYNEFNPSTCKFKHQNKFQLILNFINFILKIFIIKIIGKKNFKQRKYDIIIDEVDNERQFNKFENLLKKFKNPIIFTSKKDVAFKAKSEGYSNIVYHKTIPNHKILSKKFLKTLIFMFQILKTSFNEEENYINFYQKIIFSILKNETLFSKSISNIILQDRFYINCPIKNFIFKKYGGKKIISCQYHLAESGICFYSDIDILFSFGDEKKTEEKLKIFGSRIENSYPIGSLEMEREFYYESKNFNEIEDNIDLLIIGINPSHWIKISKKIHESYYRYLKWIRDFAKTNPKIKIVYKHHTSFKGDKKEDEILKFSNIKILKEGNSYKYLKKSKVVISYGSTMILEGLSLKKKCFFVDPDSSATTFYSYHNFEKYFILNSYDEFCKKILDNSNSNENLNLNFERMCLESENVSNNIYDNIIKL
tara:strand:+ start:7836 stop:9281 length:1446 start_codon:yes stop_codon:yes gene_type:complete